MIKLGKTDLVLSPIGLGADHMGTAIDERESFAILDRYLAVGGNFIDTANVYGKWVPGAGNASEQLLGRYLKQRHPEVVIATKGGHYTLGQPIVMRLSKEAIAEDLEESRKALGLETIDLYYLHRDDPERTIGEILETLEDLVKEGKIRYYAASNFTAERLWEAERYAAAHRLQGFSAVSNRYSPLLDDGKEGDDTLVSVKEEDLAFHRESRLPLIPYQATARGYFQKCLENRAPAWLTARYDNEENRALYKALSVYAEEKHCSLQTATLVRAATADFQILPLTSVRSKDKIDDIADAIRLLS